MGILAECPFCHTKQGTKNKVCKCGQSLDKAKRAKKVKYWISYKLPDGKVKRESVDTIEGLSGCSIEDARDAFAQKRVHKREKKLFDVKKDTEMTFNQLTEWYLELEKVKALASFDTIQYSLDKFNKVFGDFFPEKIMKQLAGDKNVNMTLLGFNLSNFVNGVAKKHGEVSQNMFPGYQINSITNGVHSFTWTSESMKKLFDKYLPGWANEPEIFVRVGAIPDEEIWDAHMESKKKLIDYVNSVSNTDMDVDTLTIGFARRATAYKRADLLFTDLERLEKIAAGKIQVIYAGKAHPKDEVGKKLIENIYALSEKLKGKIKLSFIENYNMEIALKLVSGVDIWLNTPLRPLEASGTSGMKAAHNGVMNFSVLDGWWIEGHIEDFTGWAIGPAPTELEPDKNMNKIDADDLYHKLETKIIPKYYNDRKGWIRMMQNAIGKNAYYFNTHRMMRRYVTEAYIR
jgi:starch phosphorylase